jgi:hypothetical protein
MKHNIFQTLSLNFYTAICPRFSKYRIRGVLQSSGSVIIVSLKLSELLEILDHPVSETRPSNFVESGSVEQASALHINQKLEHPV